ncbi:MAG: phage tail tape measure protein [candidate division KSB1 bacterium]|nr:phage tail tape measure protein [candidate division KSB1 bacterium]
MPSAGKVWVTIEVQDKTKTGIESSKKNFKSLGDTISSISVGQVLALGGVTMAIQKTISAYMEFDRSIRQIATLFDNFSKDDIHNVSEEIKTMALEFGQSIDSMAKARYDIISAGFFSISESAQIVDTASKLAISGVSSIAKTADVLTSVLNAYQMSAEEAIRVSDILFETVRIGKTTVEELASSFGMVSAIAPTLGVTLEELGASVATLTSQGLSTAEVITSLQATIVSLLKPSESLTTRLRSLGFDSGQAAVEALGFTDALKMITQGATEADLAAMFPNIRAMRAVFPLIGASAQTYAENLESVAASAGATDKAFEKMAESSSFRFDQLRTRLQILSVETGEALLPIGEAVATVVEAFTALPTELQTSTIAIVGFGVAIGALTPLISNLIVVGKALAPMLLQARLAVTGFFTSLGPVGWLLIGLGAFSTLLLSLTSSSKQASSGITFLTGSMDESAKAGRELQKTINDATRSVTEFDKEIKALSIAQLEEKLRELENKQIKISLGIIPETPLPEVVLPEIADPLKFQLEFTTTGLDETSQAIQVVESETVQAYSEIGDQIAAIQARINALKEEQKNAARSLSEAEKEALNEVAIYRQQQTSDLILRLAQKEIEVREKTDAEILESYKKRLETEFEEFQQSQQTYLDLRSEFLLTDEQREMQNLVNRLNAWNENWADLEEGQKIFQAGLEAIQRRSLGNQQTAYSVFINNISSQMVSSIGNYAIGYLDRRFGDFIERQRNEFERFLAFIVSEFIKSISKMIVEAQAAKLMKLLFGAGGGPLGFLSALFSEGGIIEPTPGLAMGDIITHRAPGMARGWLVPNRPGKFVAFLPRGVDTVPAMLQPGEAVISRQEVEKNEEIITALINGSLPSLNFPQRFQAGGIVQVDQSLSLSPMQPIKMPIAKDNAKEKTGNMMSVNLNINISAIDGDSVEQIVNGREFRRAIADIINDSFLRLRAGNVNVEVKY